MAAGPPRRSTARPRRRRGRSAPSASRPFLRTRLAERPRRRRGAPPRPAAGQPGDDRPGGSAVRPPEQAGIATLTASVLDEGTARRSALEIAATAERLGGYFTAGADWDVGYLADRAAVEPPPGGARAAGRDRHHPRPSPRPRSSGSAASGSPRSCGGARTPRPSPTTASSARSTAAPSTPSRSTATRRRSPRLDRDALLGFYRSHYGFAGSTLIVGRRPRPRGAPARDRGGVRRRRPAGAAAGAAGTDPSRRR